MRSATRSLRRVGGSLVRALALGTLIMAAAPRAALEHPSTFATLANEATATLTDRFYQADGRWRMCLDPTCRATNQDWGADSLTDALFARWQLTHDAALVSVFKALEVTETHYGPCRGPACREWSDVPMWDAVAAVRTFDVTHDRLALRNAEDAYTSMATSDAYALGACPQIDFQLPHGAGGGLKTLESDSNAVLAGVLLAQRTGKREYLAAAAHRYAAIRRWFFDRTFGLYTAYVFDDGHQCKALPRRFFASVNGVMTEAGLELARATGNAQYARDAHLTAHALAALADARGIFADLQAENDTAAPLVLAMLALSANDGVARGWILRNAAAAAHARTASGAYGRFFDGPPPAGIVTAWQTSGGLALEIAAGSLAPHQLAGSNDPWARATPSARHVIALPAELGFTGSGIALLGTIGERCCEAGRARVRIDGREMVDLTGIWQNKSSAGRSLPNSVLFAWRWPTGGRHVLRFEGDAPNAKEGGPFLDIRDTIVTP